MDQETAMRVGDKVVWDAPQFSGGSGFRGRVKNSKFVGTKRMSGVVHKHSYGEKTGQHTFTDSRRESPYFRRKFACCRS